MKRGSLARLLLTGAVVASLAGSVLAVVANGADETTDVSNFAAAPPSLQRFCDTLPCMFVPTQDFGLTDGRELVANATPASDCPEAKEAYEAAGHKIGGFFGPCPTAEQLRDIEPVDLDAYALMAHYAQEAGE